MPTTRVIDLSHHNTIPESLLPARDAGVWGIIHKLTEGTSFVDSKVQSRRYLAQQAGMLWGLYHFIRPGKITQQAEFFVSQAESLGVADDATLYVLDYEDTGVSLDDALEFMRKVEELTGHVPVLYSGHVLKEALGGKPNAEISDYLLWLAQYSSAPTMPAGFDSYWLWQFTESGSVAGITPPVDCNAFDGTEDDLRASWSGTGEPAPGPGPEPEVATVTITIAAPPGINVVVRTEETA